MIKPIMQTENEADENYRKLVELFPNAVTRRLTKTARWFVSEEKELFHTLLAKKDAIETDAGLTFD